MSGAFIFRSLPDDADLLVAAIGLANADAAAGLSEEGRRTLQAAALAFVEACRAGFWTAAAVDATDKAAAAVNAATPGAWPPLPPRLSCDGCERLDFSLPAKWGCRIIADWVAQQANVPGRLWDAIGKLQAVCERRLTTLRAAARGNALLTDLPDVAQACAAVVGQLARLEAVITFNLPPDTEGGEPARLTLAWPPSASGAKVLTDA
jgi:hypothetical protein